MKWRLTSLFLSAAMAASCGGESVDTPANKPKPARAKKKKAAAAKKKGLPEEIEEAPQYVYSAVGKRDPFRSYLDQLAAAGQEATTQRKREATERFEIDQYKLTGLITGTARAMAMVEDPSGKGHSLRMGSRLGKNGGKVTRITTAGIVVTEEFRAPTGERIKVPIVIDLPKEKVGFDDEE